jgi:hypothetical protein
VRGNVGWSRGLGEKHINVFIPPQHFDRLSAGLTFSLREKEL